MSGKLQGLVQSGFANMDDYCGYELEAIAILFLVLNTTFFLLRFYTRCVVQKAPMACDDYLIFPAYLTVIGICILGLVTLEIGGVGHHVVGIYFQDPGEITGLLKSLVAVSYIYLTAEALTRAAICCLYLRIFQERKLRYGIYGILAFIVANWIAYMVAFSLACRPFNYLWGQFQDPDERGAECIDITALYKSIGFPAVAIDVALLVVPIPTTVTLKLPLSQKIAITVVFLTGSLGLISSILRMAIFFRANPLTDITWTANELQIWSIVEPGMYFIAACMVTLRPFLVKCTPNWAKKWLEKLSSVGTSPRLNFLSRQTQPTEDSPRLPTIHATGFRVPGIHETHDEKPDMDDSSVESFNDNGGQFDVDAMLENEKWRFFKTSSKESNDLESGKTSTSRSL